MEGLFGVLTDRMDPSPPFSPQLATRFESYDDEAAGGGGPLSLPRPIQPEGKIFVGGLNWITTTESLKAHFERFGAIADCVIMKDRNTQQPRGFGFVTFVDPNVANEVASQKQVMVDGRNVEVKRAVPRGDDDPARRSLGLAGVAPRLPLSSLGVKRIPGGSMSTKIFVGGISWSTTDEEFLKHFERYGPVAAAHVMKYRDGTPRGFGYVTFMTEDSVDRACSSRNNIGGREVDVKRAVSKEEMEIVKGTDPVSAQHLAGLPSGLGLGGPGGLSGLNPNIFSARAGQAVGGWPTMDRNVTDMLLLQQELAAGGGVNQPNLSELLAGLNLQQSASRYQDPGDSNGQNSSMVALQEMMRQQTFMNSGNLRQQQLSGGASATTMNPNILNQLQHRFLAEGQAAALMQTANARANAANASVFSQGSSLQHHNMGGLHQMQSNMLYQQAQRQGNAISAMDMMQQHKAQMMQGGLVHANMGNDTLISEYDQILPAMDGALRLMDESGMPRQGEQQSRADNNASMWGSVGASGGSNNFSGNGSMSGMDLQFGGGTLNSMDSSSGMQSLGSSDLHGDGSLASLGGVEFNNERSGDNLILGPPSFPYAPDPDLLHTQCNSRTVLSGLDPVFSTGSFASNSFEQRDEDAGGGANSSNMGGGSW